MPKKGSVMIKIDLGIYMALIIIAMRSSVTYTNEWTWVYKKKFCVEQVEKNKHKKELVCGQIDLPFFTQLIFSWNAQRPVKGYLRFAVQVRDTQTGLWSDWHTMFDWGHMVQRSYKNETSKGLSDYIHVRLEMRNNKHADGFKIKALCYEGATLGTLKGFALSSADYHKFMSETSDDTLLALSSVAIAGIPFYSQYALDHPRADSLCSPTSYSMLTSFLMKKTIDPLEFARNAYDYGLDIYGSWPFNNAYAYECCCNKAWFWTIRCNSFRDIHAQLVQGIPTIVSIRGPLPGGASEYKNGHLVVIIGWDKQTQEVLCYDPAFNDNRQEHRYKLKDFLCAWEKSRRLTYYVELCA